VDELDFNLTLTCTLIDIICELLAGIISNNTLQQEAVVRWTKLIIGNISEPILQVGLLALSIFNFYLIKIFINFMGLFAENDSLVVRHPEQFFASSQRFA